MKKLILIILVIGAFLTACGGGGQTAELPPEEGAKPAEVSVPTSAAEATPVPTPTPIPEPEPSPEYGPPPIIDLTVVYPDGESITIPIYCPVPAEYCDTGIEVYSEDWQGNVSYWGLGFILPEGTPIFAVGEGLLDGGGGASRMPGEVTWKYEWNHYLYGKDHTGRKADWVKVLPEIHKVLGVHFEYYHSGSSAFYPYPEMRTDGGPEWDDDRFYQEFWVSGGQELGRIVDNHVSLSYWPLGPEGVEGIYDEDEVYSEINFVFEVRVAYRDGTGAPCRIYFNSQSTSSPEPTPAPEPTAEPTLTEVSVACPVPEEFRNTGMNVYDANGNHIGIGFSLPKGTPILAVEDGMLGDYVFNPSRDEDGKWVYSFSFNLHGAETSFLYTYTGFSTVFLNPTIMSGVPYFPTPQPVEVSEGQELGKVRDPNSVVTTVYGPDGQEIPGINLILATGK